METTKTGLLIRQLRCEKQMTQKQLADKMNLSDKTVSKWERGLGCPDISLLNELSDILDVSVEKLLNGDLAENNTEGGNMKKSKYFVCPICGSITVCTGGAEIMCCGRKLEAMTANKAENEKKLTVEDIEGDWFITSECKMTKGDYISFVAFAKGDSIQIIKQYPEWNLQVNIPKRGHGTLIWYSTKDGLLYQLL